MSHSRMTLAKEIFATAKRQATASVNRDKEAIIIRVMMIFCYSMLQNDIDPEMVQKVRETAENLVATKFEDLKKDGVAEAWLRNQLDEDGIHFDELPPEVSFDF